MDDPKRRRGGLRRWSALVLIGLLLAGTARGDSPDRIEGEPPDPPNPATWVFDSSPAEVAAAAQALFATSSGTLVSEVFECEAAANARLRREPGREHDLELRLVGSDWPSPVYHSGDRPLRFTGRLRVHPEAVGEGRVRVAIETVEPRVAVGARLALLAPCPGPKPVERAVAATTVVESVVLRTIGEGLGAKDLPALRVPDGGMEALLAEVERGVGSPAGEQTDARFAARVLGLIRAKRAVPILEKAMNGGGTLGMYAAEALGEMDDAVAVPALKRGLDSEDDRVRLASGRALGRLGTVAKDAGPALLTACRKAEAGMGDSIIFIEALARVDPESREVRALLEGRLEGGSPWDRLHAAAGLARLGIDTDRTVPLLTEGLRAVAEWDRWWAATALGELGKEAAPAAAALASAAREDGDAGVRAAATLALFRIRDGGPR